MKMPSPFEVREQESKSARAAEESFNVWMGKAEIKLIISMLPAMPDDRKEHFNLLLHTAFKTGFDSGQGYIAITMLGRMMDKDGSK
jgi:hypothetical protein